MCPMMGDGSVRSTDQADETSQKEKRLEFPPKLSDIAVGTDDGKTVPHCRDGDWESEVPEGHVTSWRNDGTGADGRTSNFRDEV